MSSVVQEDPKKAIFKMAEDQIDILNNVRLLIARMDGNCKELKQLLEEEQNRTNMLRETIDWHAYKRIHDLPMAVQKGNLSVHILFCFYTQNVIRGAL